MKVLLFNNHLLEVNKSIDSSNADAESPGLVMVRGRLSRKMFCNNLKKIVQKPESRVDY